MSIRIKFKFLLLLVVVAAASSLEAQTLTVRNFTPSPSNAVAETGTSVLRLIGGFELLASGGNVTVNGITLTTTGSGDWSTDVDQTDGVQFWLDNADMSFDQLTDTLIGTAPGANPTAPVILSGGLNVSSGSSAVLWLVVRTTSIAGASVPETFSAGIGAAGDVSVAGSASVTIGTPAPQSSTLSVVTFFLTSFVPTSGGQGQPILVTGSGFTAPVSIAIAGNLCPGTAVISGGGTQITGLVTPGAPGKGDHPIILTTGLLGPRTLSFTFSVGGEGGQTGCTTTEDVEICSPLKLLACLVVLFIPAFRRRNWKRREHPQRAVALALCASANSA